MQCTKHEVRKTKREKTWKPLLWFLVHLLISQFIVKSLFLVPVDVVITLIVNHINFSM